MEREPTPNDSGPEPPRHVPYAGDAAGSAASAGVTPGPDAPVEGPGEGAPRPARVTLADELERGLAEALGGFVVLDRDLELAAPSEPTPLGPAAADLIGLDGAGRLVLVQLLDGADTADALGRALDLAAHADGRRGLLERHFGRSLGEERALVVLVGAEPPESLVRRAAAVGPERLRLLAARELRTARGTTTWFAPLEAIGPGGLAVPGGPAADFERALAGLAEGPAALADLVRARLSRLGGDVLLARIAEGLVWRWRGAAVCSLVARGGLLEGRVEVDGAFERRALGDQPAVEHFLDLALARYLALVDGATGGTRDVDLADLEVRPKGASVGVLLGAPLGVGRASGVGQLRREAPSGLLSRDELDALASEP